MPRDRFKIVIEGIGTHHESSTADADYLAKQLIRDLGVKGATVDKATFSPGGPDPKKPGSSLVAEELDVT